MKFTKPELAHQFGVRLHHKTRELLKEFDRWATAQNLPETVVTAISRDPSFYEEHSLKPKKFSWHFVDCAADVRNRHYSPAQLQAVEAWFREKCRSSEWELVMTVHGTGPHIHVAWREYSLRRRWERNAARVPPSPHKE